MTLPAIKALSPPFGTFGTFAAWDLHLGPNCVGSPDFLHLLDVSLPNFDDTIFFFQRVFLIACFNFLVIRLLFLTTVFQVP